MDITDFKRKLDNRELWGGKEMWKAAYKWEKQANEGGDPIKWSWDCGLKLDYDGDICRISSRFYPPHKSHADYMKYCGTITVMVFEDDVFELKIEAETLDELKIEVEKCVSGLKMKLKTNIKTILK